MTKHFGTILHVISFSATAILLGILWYHFHASSSAKSARLRAAQGSVMIYSEPVHLRDGTDTAVPVAEFNHTVDDDVFRVHQEVDGKGIRVVRYIRRHNGKLDFVKEFTIGGRTLREEESK